MPPLYASLPIPYRSVPSKPHNHDHQSPQRTPVVEESFRAHLAPLIAPVYALAGHVLPNQCYCLVKDPPQVCLRKGMRSMKGRSILVLGQRAELQQSGLELIYILAGPLNVPTYITIRVMLARHAEELDHH
jgi:hypothetical protein